MKREEIEAIKARLEICEIAASSEMEEACGYARLLIVEVERLRQLLANALRHDVWGKTEDEWALVEDIAKEHLLPHMEHLFEGPGSINDQNSHVSPEKDENNA